MDSVELPRYTRQDEECFYWLGEFCRRGMTLSHAEVLAFDTTCDRHAVRVALERGCDPDTAFKIFSN